MFECNTMINKVQRWVHFFHINGKLRNHQSSAISDGLSYEGCYTMINKVQRWVHFFHINGKLRNHQSSAISDGLSYEGSSYPT